MATTEPPISEQALAKRYTTIDAGQDMLQAGDLIAAMDLAAGTTEPLPIAEPGHRGPGRPAGKKWDRPITFMADPELEDRLNVQANKESRSRSSLIRLLLEQGLSTR